jgi:hypothetical protein
MGRAIGILIADGSDGTVIKKIRKAATDAGATVKIVAPSAHGPLPVNLIVPIAPTLSFITDARWRALRAPRLSVNGFR